MKSLAESMRIPRDPYEIPCKLHQNHQLQSIAKSIRILLISLESLGIPMKPIANQLHPLQNQVEFLGIHDARYVNLLVSCRRGSYFDDSVQNLLPNSAAIYAVGFFLHRYRVDENEKIAAAYHLVACDNNNVLF